MHFIKANGTNVSDAEISFGTIFKHFLEYLIIIPLIVLLHCLDEMSNIICTYSCCKSLIILHVYLMVRWHECCSILLCFYCFFTAVTKGYICFIIFKRWMWPLISLECMLHTISALLHAHYRTKALHIWSKPNRLSFLSSSQDPLFAWKCNVGILL